MGTIVRYGTYINQDPSPSSDGTCNDACIHVRSPTKFMFPPRSSGFGSYRNWCCVVKLPVAGKVTSEHVRLVFLLFFRHDLSPVEYFVLNSDFRGVFGVWMVSLIVCVTKSEILRISYTSAIPHFQGHA